jgi:hypothetical protein
MADGQAAPAIPFVMGSSYSERASFALTNVALAAAAIVIPPNSPVMIPAVGYVAKLRMEVTGTLTGGGAATYNADAPWNVIASVVFRNSAGQNLIAPLTGYELYLYNKYGNMGSGLASGTGPYSDPKFGRQYSATTTGFHFFLDIPFQLDPEAALGLLPALASNRTYQLEIQLNAITTIFGGTVPTAVAVTIDTSVIYWDQPPAATPAGQAISDSPVGLNTLALVAKESAILPAGEALTRVSNVGNIIRQIIFVKRSAAGVRTDADWSAIAELYIDNNPRLRLKKTEWEDFLQRTYGYGAAAKDVVGGLDTGVYVLPFDALLGSLAGDPANTRAQLLATLDATLLQLRGYSWGTASDVLTMIVQQIVTPNAQFVYSK